VTDPTTSRGTFGLGRADADAAIVVCDPHHLGHRSAAAEPEYNVGPEFSV